MATEIIQDRWDAAEEYWLDLSFEVRQYLLSVVAIYLVSEDVPELAAEAIDTFWQLIGKVGTSVFFAEKGQQMVALEADVKLMLENPSQLAEKLWRDLPISVRQSILQGQEVSSNGKFQRFVSGVEKTFYEWLGPEGFTKFMSQRKVSSSGI